jgi:excisionase family DNA binding protein
MGKSRTDLNNADGGGKRVTIAEAATLLGVHRDTVRSRIKAGVYDAEKVVTERGPRWMIDRDSLTTNTPQSAPQPPVDMDQQEALQELARAIVREERQLEADKMEFERIKIQTLLISGVVVASVAFGSLAPSPIQLEWVLTGAFAAVVLAYSFGFARLRTMTYYMRRPLGDRRKAAVWLDFVTELLSYLGFAIAVFLFALWALLQWWL